MGRFATTVPYYKRYREPYPESFFQTIAERLHFSGRERLGDIGCGPAPLALGFSRYVGSCTGIDPELEMLEAAGEEAAKVGVKLSLIEARIGQLADALEPVHIVTIAP